MDADKEKIKVDDKEKKDSTIKLKLGDIIEIESPTNLEFHQNSYIIDYIDTTMIQIINIATMKQSVININKNNRLTDESITSIYLLNRSDVDGYARQNNLNTHTWLDIHIGGEIPVIITGEITNLEEDMIEFTTFPEGDTIYVDFAYKGVPRDIPFEKFIIRAKPTLAKSNFKKVIDDEGNEIPEEEQDIPAELATMEMLENGEMTIDIPENAIPDENIREVLHDMYSDANDVIFGEELDDIVQQVEIPEHQRKYGVEIQANDLMDELLSTIPNHKRSAAVINNIGVLINRFKELRDAFSHFDDNDNVVGYVKNGPLLKPIIEKIQNLNTKIRWIIPVVEQKRKLYLGADEEENEETFMNNDIISVNQIREMKKEEELNKIYTGGNQSLSVNKYAKLNSELHKYNKPFDVTNNDNALISNKEISVELDAVVSNMDNFYSTVAKYNKKQTLASRKRFVIQRYGLGLTKKDSVLMKSGKTIFVRNNLTPNDKITVKSLIFMPKEIVEFSKVDLPGTNILTRSEYTQNFASLFKMLKNNTQLTTHVIENIENEIQNDDDKDEFLSNMKEYVLDSKHNSDPDKFKKMLDVVIPKTRDIIKIIRKFIKNKLSIHAIVKELEPFMIDKRDLSYQQQNELRFTVKTAIQEFNKELDINESRLSQVFAREYDTDEQLNRIERMFYENKEMVELFKDGYKLNDNKRSSGELINKLLITDSIIMFSDIITALSVKTLTTPSDLLKSFEPGKIDDLEENEGIKAKDCTRRYLTKSYESLKDLQDDNGKDEIYYDDEHDDTPYGLMELYSNEKKEMEPSVFKEFLEESLIQKHDVQSNYAQELAVILIAGKKTISNGEYAILSVKPGYGNSVDEELLTPKEKRAAEIEAESRKKQGYYQRKQGQWIYDNSIDPEMFIDSNTLFCNIRKDCNKNEVNNMCEPTSFSKKRIDQLNKSRMVKEFENRIDSSIEQLDDKIKKDLLEDYKRMRKNVLLREKRLYKYNNFSYEYGKLATDVDRIVSPHEKTRDAVLSQVDFVKKQGDIIRIVDMYCREPMLEMKEDEYWLYCKDTNTKLMPSSLHKLALAFVLNTNYTRKLDAVCASHGVLSDDGDSIVDKHSGFILKKIDFLMQDTYNDDGFMVQTHDIMEKDIDSKIADIFTPSKTPIFENKTNEIIYNITNTMCSNMGIPIESVHEFVIRVSSEIILSNVLNEIRYNELATNRQEKTGKSQLTYETYKNRLMLWIIASVLLISVQTAVPGHRIKKTFPGCSRSFSGYPLNGGVEDISAIEYFACVMHKLKSTISPWDSISKLKKDIYATKIKEVLEKYIVDKRPDIMELYTIKRKYSMEHPNEIIPDEHSIGKWNTFMPPVVPFHIAAIQPVSKDFEKNFLESVRKGHHDQRSYINTMSSKAALFGFDTIELINKIVITKDPLLKTASFDPFLENSCCDSNDTNSAIQYFINENPLIGRNNNVGHSIHEMLRETQLYSRPSLLHHNEFTGISHSVVNDNISDEHIYGAFIYYCNFNNDMPIPVDLIGVCPEKPDNFPVHASILDKIDFLKKNGRRYTIGDLNNLMLIIHNNNIVATHVDEPFTQINVMYDILDSFDTKDSQSVEPKMREHLRKVMGTYKKGVMVSEMRDELMSFNAYLYNANKKMFKEIVTFLNEYGNLATSKFNKIQDILLNVYETDTDNVTGATSHVSNMTYLFTRTLPEMILNGKQCDTIHQHWSLSKVHARDLKKAIDKHWNNISQFHGDVTLVGLLKHISDNTQDLYLLLDSMPVCENIIKKNAKTGTDEVFYSVFDNDSIKYMHQYLLYSTLYEYIIGANDVNLLTSDIELKKGNLRTKNLMFNDIAAQTRAIDDVNDDNELMEVEISMTDETELKKRVANMLVVFLDIEQENKKGLMKYDEISKKIHKAKVKEKQKIVTQDLGNLDNDVRRVESQLKKYKMGRWNIGLQRGLVHYDKNTYDRERNEMDADNLIDRDIEQLDAVAEEDIEEAYANEGNDISHLADDYMDGNYYGDENAENDFGDN